MGGKLEVTTVGKAEKMMVGTIEVTTGRMLEKTGKMVEETGIMVEKTGNMAEKVGSSAALAKISLNEEKEEKAAGRGKKFQKYLKQLPAKIIQTRILKHTRGYRKVTPSPEGPTQQAITTMMMTEVTLSMGGGSRSVMTATAGLHKGDGSPNVI